LEHANEIQFYGRSKKHLSIWFDSQTALEVLQATRTSPLVKKCQKTLNDISTWHAVGPVLGPWTCGGTRKWNCLQAHKWGFCSAVCWTWASFGSF
jgi:hypothetical protein